MMTIEQTDYGTYEDAGIPCIVLGVRTPVARLEHTCTHCSKKIKPGQRYRRYRLIVEGEPMVQKECPSCIEIAQGL